MTIETGLSQVQTRGEDITCVENALLIPRNGSGGFCLVDAHGAPVVDATSFRKDGFEFSGFVDRDQPIESRHLTGRYLYAGDFWTHFGHFIFESLSRLWALDHLSGAFDAIVFRDTHRAHENQRSIDPDSMQGKLLALLGIDTPVLILSEPTSFDALYVPRQGCGMGALAAGTPAHRRFLQSRLRRITPKQGAERLYLTRSGYRMRRGGIFAEAHLEQNLIEQGYTIYAPEKAPIEDQIATYLGACQIVAPDSSALHLFGFVGRPDQDLAIVLRRTDGAKDLLPQITGFTGRKPLVADCITRILSRDNARIPTWGQFADLNFAQLGKTLAEAGFIDDLSRWHLLSNRRRLRTQNAYEKSLSCTLTESPPQRG